MLSAPKIAAVILVSCFWLLSPSCDEKNHTQLPTEEELRRELKPGQSLVYYHRELLPGLNREIVRARVLDKQTNSISEIIRTTKRGEQLNYLALRELNRSAIRTKYGAGGMGFDAGMDGKPERKLLFTVQLLRNADRAAVTREISSLGATIKDSFSDLLSITALPAVAKKIARLKHVEAIIEEKPPALQALDMARDLAQDQLKQKHAEGWGRELLTAIWETDACINRIHPDFQRVQWENRFTEECDTQAAAIKFHSTMVADIFAAFRSDSTAGLFQGRLFDVDDNDKSAVDDMWARKPNIVNASFTTSVFDGRRIDEEVRKNRSIHVFTGVGNNLTNGEEIACFGYNALCVGGYVQNIVGDYSDDIMGPSSWKDHFGIEKPQVLGPYVGGKLATRFFSGGQPEYQTKTGSSFATPAVSGLAGLLIANYPFDLKQWPEAVRAVLMASAHVHPILSEGHVIPDFNDNIDDKMGVGAPNGNQAKKIMDEHMMRYGSFLPGLSGQLAPVTFTARRGDSVRVVVTWDQCPDYNVGDPELSVDLDMVVTAPGFPGPGSTRSVFTNFSRADNWEVVQFTMPNSGNVTIFVSAPLFRPCNVSGNPQLVNYGLAWSTIPAGFQTRNSQFPQ